MAGLLYWCAGADTTHLGTSKVERAWYQAVGLSVLLTALVSAVSMTFALTVSLGGTWWHYLPFSALWALFVFNIDRWLVSTVHYGPLDETNEGHAPLTAGRVVGYLARFGFALVLAVIIAEPIVLRIFDREIDQQIASTQTAAVNSADQRVRARPEFVERQAAIDAARAGAATEVTQARAADAAANKALDDETSGRGGSLQSGCGARCQERQADLRAADARVSAAVAAQRTVTAATATRSATLDSDIAAAVAVERRAIANGDGLLAREHALTQLMRADPDLRIRRWFVSLLFLLVDLVPLLLKMFGPATMHDRRIRLAAAAEAVAQGRLFATDQAHQDAAVIAGRRALERETELEQVRVREHGRRAQLDRTGSDPLPAAAPPATTSVFVVNGRWVLDHPLLGADRGGFGDPYLAHDIGRPSFQVVLKRVRPSAFDDSGAQERARRYLLTEQQLPAKVDSPYVAPVLESGDDPKFGLYLVTPYFAAGTIARRIQDREFVPTLEWALRITGQLLSALIDCFDQALLIHLDVKPSNAALDDAGNIRLIDFGLARVISEPGGPSSFVPAFTLWYAPPEQIRRLPNWKNSAADVRAVAATLYVILTGEPPLQREAGELGLLHTFDPLQSELMTFVCDPASRPARVDVLNPQIPGYVADLIDQWLGHDPARRAPGVSDLAARNALEALSEVQDKVRDAGLDHLPVGRTRIAEPAGAAGGRTGASRGPFMLDGGSTGETHEDPPAGGSRPGEPTEG